MFNKKGGNQQFTYSEGDDEDKKIEEFLKKGDINDTIQYISNNQEGYKLYKIVEVKNDEPDDEDEIGEIKVDGKTIKDITDDEGEDDYDSTLSNASSCFFTF